MRLLWVMPTIVFSAAIALSARPALAQSDKGDEVSATGKGITGGVLLGGEAVMLTEAALGVKPAWAYIVGGVAGGIAGGVGGYFAEQEGSAKLSLYLLAGGMVLAIPTTVAVLSVTAYRPPVDYTQDRTPVDEPVAEPAQPATAPAPATTPSGPSHGPMAPQSRRMLPRKPQTQTARLEPDLAPALVGIRPGTLTLSLPAVQVREAYTARERAMYGVGHATQVSVSLLSGRF